MTASDWGPDSPADDADAGGKWLAVFVGAPGSNRLVQAPLDEHFPPAELDGCHLLAANEATRVATYRAAAEVEAASPRAVRPNTCGRCDATWTGLAVAHCGGCHETFAGVTLFDLHRVDGRCVHPFEVLTRDGEPRLFRRDGMWRGPEMPPEALAAFVKEAS